jgi:hypothetical protein
MDTNNHISVLRITGKVKLKGISSVRLIWSNEDFGGRFSISCKAKAVLRLKRGEARPYQKKGMILKYTFEGGK